MSRLASQMNRMRYTLLLGLLSVFLVFSIIIFPEQSFNASLQSLTIWWTIVFPALLPFLIIAEIMLAYGLIHFVGMLLEPFMRILFRLPGVSGPVMAVGFTIGYPVGAKMTQQLRQQDALNRSEGQLLLSLSHVASPLLIINVIAVGFFGNAQLGIILILIQLASLMTMGFMLRLFLPRTDAFSRHIHEARDRLAPSHHSLLRQALQAMRSAHQADGRSFGKLLGDAVGSAIQTLMMIGGYMLIFAVIIQVLTMSQLTKVFHTILKMIMSENMSSALFKGLFEIHLGSYAVSESLSGTVVFQMAMLGALLAWSGLAVHAQVASFIQKTDLRYSTFIKARLIHAGLAILFTFMLWQPLNQLLSDAVPSFFQLNHMYGNQTTGYDHLGELWRESAQLIGIILTGMLFMSLIFYTIEKIIRRPT